MIIMERLRLVLPLSISGGRNTKAASAEAETRPDRKGGVSVNSPAQPARRATTRDLRRRDDRNTHAETIANSRICVNPRSRKGGLAEKQRAEDLSQDFEVNDAAEGGHPHCTDLTALLFGFHEAFIELVRGDLAFGRALDQIELRKTCPGKLTSPEISIPEAPIPGGQLAIVSL